MIKFWSIIGAFNAFLFSIILFKSFIDFNIALIFISISGLIAWVLIIKLNYDKTEEKI